MSVPNHNKKFGSREAFSAKDYVRAKGFKKRYKFPKKYIFAYFQYAKKYFLRKHKSKRIRLYEWLTIYKNDDIGFVLLPGPGAPAAGGILEEIIALGGEYIINTGTAGGLKKRGVIVCTKALKDDGTSHHYEKNGRFSYPDAKLTALLEKTLKDKKIPYTKGPTWTIDAIYRETEVEFEKYMREGIYTVEMEASALFTVGKIRKAKVASMFIVSDLLFNKNTKKFHRIDTKKHQRMLIDAAYDCLKKIK